MQCPKCQFGNREGAKFCGKCGSKFEITCPECGAKNLSDNNFCDECGYNLQRPIEAPGLDYSKPKSYTPKYLADKILSTRSSIEGERKLVTVMFADVAGFTAISESLDPEDVHQIMDGCFKIMMEEIHKYEGTINQFTGDGVMAIFGAPVAHEDHAQRACYAALSVRKIIQNYSDDLKRRFGINFNMRIGLNLGPVVVGSIGDDLRMDYTAVGDTTNLAERMEGLAEPGTIIVSESTYKLAKDYFKFGPMQKVKVKGKKKLQNAYEILTVSEIVTRFEAASAKGLTRFVGRSNSMHALMESFNKAHSGSGQVVSIVGDAGVGKSRTLLEFRNQLPQDEITFLEGSCVHYGDSMAYLPVLEYLKVYFQIKENENASITKKRIMNRIAQLDVKLTSILPAIYDLLSLQPDDETYRKLQPQQKRDKIFEALRNFLVRESQNKTLVVAIEDLHWIDKTSEEFLNYMIGWLVGTKILLVLLYRPEYAHQWGSKSYYNKIGLDHLTNKSSTELIQAILKDGEVISELQDLIFSRSAGNPLYIEEFTHTLMENGSIQNQNKMYVLTKKFSGVGIPDSIHGLIAARIDRLEDDLKRTMQVASVVGRNFAFKVLQSTAGMKNEIKSHLLNLQDLEFIYEKSLFPELEYIFKHALTQEVAYNSLLIKRRKEIHEKIGKAMEDIYKDRLEEFYEMIAYHYARSTNLEKAYQYLNLSGKKATDSHANWEAIRFYKEAIDVLGQMPETDINKREGVQARVSLSMPAMFLSYPEDTLDVIKAGVQVSREVGDDSSLAKLNGTLAHAYAIKGESILAIEYAGKCFKGAQKNQDIDLMAPVARDLISAYMFAGDLLKAVPIFSTVIPLIEKSDKRSESFGRPASVYTFLCGLAGFITGLLGSFKEAEILCEKALVNALQSNDIFELAYSEFSYGIVALQKGDGHSTVAHLRKCVDYLEESQMTTLKDPTLASLGLGYIYKGNLEKARELADHAIVAACQPGAASGNAILTQSISSMIYSEVGDLEKAHSCAIEAVRLSTERTVGAWEGIAHHACGLVYARMGREKYKEAEECLERALIILNEYGLRPWLTNGILALGEIYARSGQSKKSQDALKKAAELFQEMGMDYWLDKTNALLVKP